MAKFSFNTVIRPTLEVELPGGKTIKVFTPSKELFEKLLDSEKAISELSSGKSAKDAVDCIYKLIADILSNNAESKQIDDAILNSIEISDAIVFITAYIDFIREAKEGKN